MKMIKKFTQTGRNLKLPFAPKGGVAGFTLIELLIVVVVIGILAAIVLVSLIDVQMSAKDAGIKSSLVQLRAVAQLAADPIGTYSGVCTAENGIENSIAWDDIIALSPSTTAICNDAATGFCVEAETNTDDNWCVDRQILKRGSCDGGIVCD